MIKRILKMIGLFLGILVLLLIIVAVLFVNFSPQFGGNPNEVKIAEYSKSANFSENHFVNREKVEMNFTFGQFVENLFKFLRTQPNSVPTKPLPVSHLDSSEVANYSSVSPRIIWFGHSTILLQISKKNILIDPMFGDVPAPHPWLGTKRFSKVLPLEIEKIPKIDAVIFSHDHYDHLDYGSIIKLKNKVKKFYVPLGLSSHLLEWGIESDRIFELDWWTETKLDDLQFVCTPAQHFSGRGLSNRNSTLWASWVIKSEENSIYFSGDSGYNTHFKEIGDKYGPFDFAMMECGQYNEQWKQIHMMPEETVQAGLDVRAKLIMPIHWGAFKLAFHTWTDPVERLEIEAKRLGLPVTTPVIGVPIILSKPPIAPIGHWWETL